MIHTTNVQTWMSVPPDKMLTVEPIQIAITMLEDTIVNARQDTKGTLKPDALMWMSVLMQEHVELTKIATTILEDLAAHVRLGMKRAQSLNSAWTLMSAQQEKTRIVEQTRTVPTILEDTTANAKLAMKGTQRQVALT